MQQSRRTVHIIALATALLISGCSAQDRIPVTSDATASDTHGTSTVAEPTATVPAAEQTATVPAATPSTLSTFITDDGMFEFDYPSDWSVVANPAFRPDTAGFSFIVQDSEGRKMATLAAGFPPANDSVVTGPIEPVPLEYVKIPEKQIAETHEGTAIAFHYETRYNPVQGEVGAEMGINTFKTEFPISASLPGFHIDTSTGAAFTRWIDPAEDLPDVDPYLKTAGGTELFEAYQRTTEYQAVKEMMISLRRLM